ncbi:retrovirus-related pol polyprotein from transposon TNT 1-94 [Tanacetum coccineum]
MSQQKEAQKKFYKTHEDKELEKVITLENKIKVLDDIVYKTGQSVQIMNMLNRNCKTSFVKPEFLKKAQRANPGLYDIVYTKHDEVTNLQCDYLEALDKCQNLQEELSKRNDNVGNQKYNEISRSFVKLEQHLISLEIALQQCKQQLKNDKVSKDERKSVETKFEKPLIWFKGMSLSKWFIVEGLNHNLFFVGQFCDADLEVAFRKSTCYIRDLKGNDLLTGSRGSYLYSITLQDTTSPNPICLMAKATSSQAWLWHRCLSHLNFDTINLLLKYDIMTGLFKLKFIKDHLCSSY